MKRKISILALAVLLVGLMACAGTQINPTPTTPTYSEVQYKALTASQELYNLSWGAFVQLYRTQAKNKDGKIIVDQEKYFKGLQYANTYYDAWMVWMTTYIAYDKSKTEAGKVSVEAKMALCSKAATDLMTIIQPYLVEGQK